MYHQRKAEFEAHRLHFKAIQWPVYVARKWWGKYVMQRLRSFAFLAKAVVSGDWLRRRLSSERERFAMHRGSVAPAPGGDDMKALEMLRLEMATVGEVGADGDGDSVAVPIAATPKRSQKKAAKHHFQIDRAHDIKAELARTRAGAAFDSIAGGHARGAAEPEGEGEGEAAGTIKSARWAKDEAASALDSFANAHPIVASQVEIDAATVGLCCCGLDGRVARIVFSVKHNDTLRKVSNVLRRIYLKIALVLVYLRPFSILGAFLGVAIIAGCAFAMGIWALVLAAQSLFSLGILVIVGAGAFAAVALFEARTLIWHRREKHLVFACLTITVFVCVAHSALATVMSVPIGSAKHDFGDGAVESVWSLLPSPMVADIQNRYGCCGYTYIDPSAEAVEVDEFGRLRKRKRGGAAKPAREGDAAASEDVVCPLRRTALSCAPQGAFASCLSRSLQIFSISTSSSRPRMRLLTL